MLETIGIESIAQLFEVVPNEVRLGRDLDVPKALTELELSQHLEALSIQNLGVDRLPCFLGAGAYDHFIPAAVDMLASRGEFYTAYTPYQAEASQGTLQAIFEYQTLVTQLTGMDVSNASLYDGGSAVAEAILMSIALGSKKGPGRIIVSEALHPEYRAVAATYLENLGPELVTVPSRDGHTPIDAIHEALNDETLAVVLQQPNFFGQLETIEPLIDAIHEHGALAIVSVDPTSLGLLRRPGSYGADIVTAEGQGLGNPLAFGGPYLGILGCRESYLRKIPGRLVGETTDRDGRRCFVLTLQTREQHIRREKATSNICTNQGLYALRSSIYLALLGPQGLREVAELSTQKAHYAADELSKVPGLSMVFEGAFFKEFLIRSSKNPQALLREVTKRGFHGGIPVGRWYPGLEDCILVAVTEKRTKAEIDGLVEAYRSAITSI